MPETKPSAASRPASQPQTAAKIVLFAVVAVGMTILDQLTKIWVRQNMEERSDKLVVVEDFFNIIHAENPGAAFGFLNDSPYRMWIFAAFTVVALYVLFRMFLELPNDDRFQNVALAMLVSGAVGNAIDRVLYQSVTDMIDMYVSHPGVGGWLLERFGTTHWPTYNIADVAIVLGLIMFGFHYLFLEEDSEDEPASPPERPLPPDEPPPASDVSDTHHEDLPTDEAPAAMLEAPTEFLNAIGPEDFAEKKTETLKAVDTTAPVKNLASSDKD